MEDPQQGVVAPIQNSNTYNPRRYGRRVRPRGTPLQWHLNVSNVANTENHAYAQYSTDQVKSGLVNPYVPDQGKWDQYLTGGRRTDFGIKLPRMLDNGNLEYFDPAHGTVRDGMPIVEHTNGYARAATEFATERQFRHISSSDPVQEDKSLGLILNIPKPNIFRQEKYLPEFCPMLKYSGITQEVQGQIGPDLGNNSLRNGQPISYKLRVS